MNPAPLSVPGMAKRLLIRQHHSKGGPMDPLKDLLRRIIIGFIIGAVVATIAFFVAGSMIW